MSIVLIGFMGAGKSEVGRALAEKTELELVDTDDLVESDAGCTIAELFKREGEPAMRAREIKAVENAVSRPNRIIATGGGTILALRNCTALREAGEIIYLRATPESLRARLKGSSARPLLKDPAAFDHLLAERIPAYEAAADVIVDTDGKEPRAIAAEILALVRS